MARKPKKEQSIQDHFTWLLGQRNGVYFADGRGNTPPLGRHSLGTRDRDEAIRQLRQLDLTMAVKYGRADASLLRHNQDQLLALEDGRKRYMDYVQRPAIQGGATAGTIKRYRTVLDKFSKFVGVQKLRYWNQVNRDVLMGYNQWMVEQDYHGKTQYIEVTVLKQVLKWLVGENLLPSTSLFRLALKKPNGTQTYCYTKAEVEAIVTHCRNEPDLKWLADVVIALATTGFRISELAGLRWSDVDRDRSVLRLTDTTRQARKSDRQDARTTKSHRDRSLPIHADLLLVLEGLPRMPDQRVFHGTRGGKIKPDTVRRVLMRDVLPVLAGQFPATDHRPGILAGRLHSFRHYFCSISADSGVPEQLLMSWLGHRESEMIRHYYHQREDESRRQMSKISFLGNAGTTQNTSQDGRADTDPSTRQE